MWQELSILHQKTGPGTPSLRGEGLRWRTCLRELLFLAPESEAYDSRAEVYAGISAHRFLVEICSGLHSPLFGETEVFGQFRSFRESHSWHPRWTQLLDAVEEDVRRLRRSHLVGIGSQSYGSLARRHIPEHSPVLLLGGGRLALDLLPWLKAERVTVALRDPRRWPVSHPSVGQVLSLEDLARGLGPENASWLLAAPLANQQLAQLWEKLCPKIVLDFRGEQQLEGVPAGCKKYLSLRALFEELETARLFQERKRTEAIQYAADLAERRAARSERAVVHRPFGWEDAFA